MAIQVNGTPVITDSKVLQNVTGLKTVNSNSILGSGDIAIDQGPALGTTVTLLGTATGSNSGSATVSCSGNYWYAVSCSGDNQGGPAGGTCGTNAVAVPPTGDANGNIFVNTCNLSQSGTRLFWATGTTVVAITGTRGTYKVYRLT